MILVQSKDQNIKADSKLVLDIATGKLVEASNCLYVKIGILLSVIILY